MKAIHITLMLLGIILFISKGNAQTTKEQSNDSTYYFLLDRNTKLISYYESKEIRDNKPAIYRTYDFFSEINSCDPMHASLYYFDKQPPYAEKTFIKPLAFLDSIRYYNEKWLTETVSLMYTHNLNKYTLYVIDKATIKNDSVTLFQVKFDCSGRE